MSIRKERLSAIKCERCQPHYPCQTQCLLDFKANLSKVKETPLPPVHHSLPSRIAKKVKNINPFQKFVYFIITTIATALGINLAGIRQLLEMEFSELTIIQFLIYVIGLIGMFALGLLKTGPGVKAKLNVLVEYLSEELIKATDEKSEAGQKITKQELIDIVEGAIKAVFK